METNNHDDTSLGWTGYIDIPNIVFDASILSAGAHCLYMYLCSLAAKRGTRALTGNILAEYRNHYDEAVRPSYSEDLCFDALFELTFPRTELGGKSYVSIELPYYLTAEEDEKYDSGRTHRIIHLNDVEEANARHHRCRAQLARAEQCE